MPRTNINDLIAFVAVARERSFTRAAAQLRVSPSALSHTMRALEESLGVRLLARTTRRVTATEAGERLMRAVGPRLDEIDAELLALGALRDKPAGNIRINTTDHAAETIILPVLARLLPDYPDIRVEIVIDYGFTDIVAERFDAGVRDGEQVAKDMVAVRIGPALRAAVVGSPAYFASHPKPQTPYDLADHLCVNVRLPNRGGPHAWEFEKDGRKLNVRVDGQVLVNTIPMLREAALAGLGLAYSLEMRLEALLAEGRLVRVLEDWCPTFSGYHLYYPSRRHYSPAFALLVEALRYRED
jgi:DNA-binding transcriptional LysR family regulator